MYSKYGTGTTTAICMIYKNKSRHFWLLSLFKSFPLIFNASLRTAKEKKYSHRLKCANMQLI